MPDARIIEGAEAFRALCAEISLISNDTCARLESGDWQFGPDTRDYVRMVEAVREGLRRHLDAADPAHASGFLRALTDLICVNVEGGCVHPEGDWDPITVTELSFSGELDRLLAAAAPEVSHG